MANKFNPQFDEFFTIEQSFEGKIDIMIDSQTFIF